MEKAGPRDHIILFDGKCCFCNRSVELIFSNDRKGIFRFAHLQSEAGLFLQEKFKIPEKIDSVIYLHNNKAFIKSSAALRIARHMKGLYPILYAFLIVPRFIRDAVYDLIARNRHKIYGRKESCMIPDPQLANRFVESYVDP